MASGRSQSFAESDDASSGEFPDICVVTHPLSAAGENATRSLLDILAAITGVALVTADLPEDSEIRDRREVVELTRKGAGDSVVVSAGRFLLNQIRMCHVLWGRSERIVLFFGATSYLLPILFSRLIGRTVLVEPRGDVPLTLRLNWEQRMPGFVARWLAGLVRGLERSGFRAAHGVITYTPSMAQELGVDPTSSWVYPIGARYVDTERFAIETPHEQRENVVGYVGRLDEEKGIRDLAATVTELPPNVTFRFVGDGDLCSWLAEELGDEISNGSVELTGWVGHEDVPAQLNDLRLLVLPSQPTEGLPTTILEALACGTPVLATPVAGVPDVVVEGETGFLLASTDPGTVGSDITAVLDREDLATIGRRGRKMIETEYSLDAATGRYKQLLSEF